MLVANQGKEVSPVKVKLGILEWRLQNAIDYSSVSAAEKALYSELVKILLNFVKEQLR
jgi:hypothetical protein